MGASEQQRLIDAAISHSIDLTHYSNDVVRRIRVLLRSLDADLANKLIAALDGVNPTTFTIRRLEELAAGVRTVSVQMQTAVKEEVNKDLLELARYEFDYQRSVFGDVLRSPSFEQVYAAVEAKPFQGKLMSEWFDTISGSVQKKLTNAVSLGFAEGRTIDEIVRTIRGRRDQNYKDGILEVTRREAEAIARTAISHTAGAVRDELYKNNADLFLAEEWVSTLDTRTTPTCQIRDGLKYTTGEHDPIGHKVPWGAGPGRIHWNCRSTSVPVMRDTFGLNLPSIRASEAGPIAATTKYGAWLLRQSAERQDEVLGPTRGKLLRQGGIKFDRFFNNEGRYLTLEQLRKNDAKAFSKAGV